MTGKKITGPPGGLPWIRVWVEHLDHRKAVDLAHELQDPHAPLYLCAAWCFFARHYPEGSMPDREAAVAALEAAARWQGERGVLVAAMAKVGLLERQRRHIRVHDWAVYQAAHIERRAKDREWHREDRARRKANSRHDIGTTSAGASTSSSTSSSASDEEATSLRSVPIIEGKAAASPSTPITPAPPPARTGSGADPWAPLRALYSKLQADQRGAFTREEQAAKQRVEARARDGVTVDAWRTSPEYRSAAGAEVRGIVDRWQAVIGTTRLPPVGTGLGGGVA